MDFARPLEDWERQNNLGELERVHRPTRKEFWQRYVTPRRPVVITGLMDDWPARTDWTPESLVARLGSRPVTVRRLDEHNVCRFAREANEVMPFAEFMAAILPTPPTMRYYLAIGNILSAGSFHARFKQSAFAELAPDLQLPDLIARFMVREVNLWIGYSEVVSNLHFDPLHNFLGMVRGRKLLHLYAPSESDCFHMSSPYAGDGSLLHSPVDVARPDLGLYPKFRHAKYQTCELQPGEVLYMPPGYWHYVRSKDFNIAVNIWWAPLTFLYDFCRAPVRRVTASILWDLFATTRAQARELYRRYAGPRP